MDRRVVSVNPDYFWEDRGELRNKLEMAMWLCRLQHQQQDSQTFKFSLKKLKKNIILFLRLGDYTDWRKYTKLLLEETSADFQTEEVLQRLTRVKEMFEARELNVAHIHKVLSPPHAFLTKVHFSIHQYVEQGV